MKVVGSLAIALFAVVTVRAESTGNFIDDEVQARWPGGQTVVLASDSEFYRRLSLDLTGRIPSPDALRAFLADSSPNKRQAAIDRLLETPEFTDRWSKWLLDLMHVSHNIYRGFTGRNAFPAWLRDQVAKKERLDNLVVGVLTSTGNNYDAATGATNFFLVDPPSGPSQDTYDLLFARAANSFLGMGHYDCLLCHNGRGHLDGISLWGSQSTRADAWRMSAFFSRYTYNRVPMGGDYFDSNFVSDRANGTYDLNTEDGNRPPRRPIGPRSSITPEYRNGTEPQTENWRLEFAQQMVKDPMFARNFANRIWKQMMGTGLVEPVDTLDPDRLDPATPPPDPWTFQASHPVLLEKLSTTLAQDFDLRKFVGLIAQSATYQLVSAPRDVADGTGQLYRHYTAHRLDAEEIHDAVTTATGVTARYKLRTTVGYEPQPVQWAMRLPGSIHPEETDEATLAFLQSFFPGDGNLLPRSDSSSVMQELNLLNSPFVTNRLKMEASPNLRTAAAMANEPAVDQIFLLFLSRLPGDKERTVAIKQLTSATSREAALEDIAWTCVNLPEFVINH